MNNKSNTVQALWVGLGYLGTFLVALGSAMVLSRYLSKDEYGTYRQIIYIYTLLQGVFAAGLPSAYSYFLPKLDLSQGKQLSRLLLFFFVILGALLSIVFYLGAPLLASALDNPTLTDNLRLFSPIPFFLIPTLGIEGLFTAVRKTEQLLVYNITTKFFMFFCLISPVLFWEPSIDKIIYGWIVSAVFSFVIALVFKNKPFKAVKSSRLPFKISAIFKYTIPIMLTSYITVLQKSADQFFISRYYGESAFAEYSNGFFEIPFVGMIVGAVSAVMIPIFSGAGNDPIKLQNAVTSWRNALDKCIYLIYPLLCVCFVFAAEVIVLIYGEKYESSVSYFKLALFLNFFNIVLINPIIIALGKTKFYLSYNIVCAVLIWLTKYLTVLLIDSPHAVAVVSVANSILLITIPYVYINKLLNIRLISKSQVINIIKIIIAAIFCAVISKYAINYLVEFDNLILSLTIKCLLYAALFAIYLILSKGISQYKSLLHSFMRKK